MSLYAGYRQSRFTFDPARSSVWKAIVAYLSPYIPEGGSVLDLGSGYCDFINAVRARRKWALDLYLDPAEFAKDGVTPLRADVTDLAAIPDGSLDVVFASNLLEHLTDDKLALTLSSVKAKLRAGGRFIAIQPNFAYCYRSYFDDYTHVRVFSHVSLPDFLESQGFAIDRVVPRFLPFSMKSRVPKWPFLVWLYLRSPVRPFAKQMLVVARKP
jgi:SAM-dependent methyltransferase